MTHDLKTAFALKLLIALGWFGLAFASVLALADDRPMVLRVLGLIAVGAPAILWTLWLQRQSRIDELEARLALVSQAEGCSWAVGFGALMWGLNTLRGEDTPSMLLALLPPSAFFFGECMAQMARWGLHRPDKRGEP